MHAHIELKPDRIQTLMSCRVTLKVKPQHVLIDTQIWDTSSCNMILGQKHRIAGSIFLQLGEEKKIDLLGLEWVAAQRCLHSVIKEKPEETSIDKTL